MEVEKDVRVEIPVPETLQKQKKNSEELIAKKKVERLENRKKNRLNRRTLFKRARHYEQERKMGEKKKIIRNRRTARESGIFFVEPEPKLAFVIRIRGIRSVEPQTRKILQLLRLRQINNAVFVKISKPMLEMLRIVEPYIVWGYPSYSSVRALIYKRGYGKVNGQRVPITDNHIIENYFHNPALLGMEDLINQIYTVGPHFKEVNKFFWPFKLSNPLGGFRYKLKHYVEGGDAGNRENRINALIKQMN